MNQALLITSGKSSKFSIENNGDFILNGKKIGKDKQIAKILNRYGEMFKKTLELQNKTWQVIKKTNDW